MRKGSGGEVIEKRIKEYGYNSIADFMTVHLHEDLRTIAVKYLKVSYPVFYKWYRKYVADLEVSDGRSTIS